MQSCPAKVRELEELFNESTPNLQEDLIGQEKERKGDEARRAKLHQQWLEQQDEQQVAQLLQGVRNGFRRKRAGDLLDDDVMPPTCFANAARPV